MCGPDLRPRVVVVRVLRDVRQMFRLCFHTAYTSGIGGGGCDDGPVTIEVWEVPVREGLWFGVKQ